MTVSPDKQRTPCLDAELTEDPRDHRTHQQGLIDLTSQILRTWPTTFRCITLLIVAIGLLVLATAVIAYFQVNIRVGPVEVTGRHLAVIPITSSGRI